MLRLLKRPLAAFLGLWFLLVMIEPESVHSCPVHSAAMGAGHSAHSGHSGHHGATQAGHQSHDKSKAFCSCPGDCTSSVFKALPSAAQELADAAIIVAASRNPIADSIQLTRTAFLQPFAIGPPAALTA